MPVLWLGLGLCCSHNAKTVGLQNAARLALFAFEDKNPDAQFKGGADIERACESCHSQYWYPNDIRPTA